MFLFVIYLPVNYYIISLSNMIFPISSHLSSSSFLSHLIYLISLSSPHLSRSTISHLSLISSTPPPSLLSELYILFLSLSTQLAHITPCLSSLCHIWPLFSLSLLFSHTSSFSYHNSLLSHLSLSYLTFPPYLNYLSLSYLTSISPLTISPPMSTILPPLPIFLLSLSHISLLMPQLSLSSLTYISYLTHTHPFPVSPNTPPFTLLYHCLSFSHVSTFSSLSPNSLLSHISLPPLYPPHSPLSLISLQSHLSSPKLSSYISPIYLSLSPALPSLTHHYPLSSITTLSCLSTFPISLAPLSSLAFISLLASLSTSLSFISYYTSLFSLLS